MGLNLDYLQGQTPLEEEEKEGLKIATITTNAELDEFEQNNIEKAVQWTIGRKMPINKLLSETFIKSLHKRMYNEVWKWAGEFRKTEKNIGVESWMIPIQLRALIDDAKFWIENNSFSEDEIAIRFKHRIVSIHCFSNGNGRHSRLMGDLIAEKVFKRRIFTWGQSDSNLSNESDARKNYLIALKKADHGDYANLIAFARS
ncbi:MAG: mobile mystery protein B [Bacteroidetes bacterium]|nr:mobile mystery protein B [Bacteroidota bacterium]MCB0802362.1 mobile mystery protein B [Flavobacteriales bacterium]NOG56724.1 mobile mystery protein B [Bacteroidota bacterium]